MTGTPSSVAALMIATVSSKVRPIGLSITTGTFARTPAIASDACAVFALATTSRSNPSAINSSMVATATA